MNAPVFVRFTCAATLLAAAFLSTPLVSFGSEPTAPVDNAPVVDQPQSVRLDGQTAEERGMALVRYVATCKPGDELNPKASGPAYAARLILNVDTEYALTKLDASASAVIQKRKDGGVLDPFDKEALVYAYFLGKDKIPQSTVEKIKQYVALWEHKELKGYAKGAWNYFLMMDGAGYLAAEEWPDLVDVQGLKAEEIKRVTKERLYRDFDTITQSNHGEYGATIYLAVNLSAIRKLAEFAKDPEMRSRASFALDAMMLDIACTWNHGLNVGSASRAKYWGSTDTSLEYMGSTAAAAWVAFGAPRSISGAGTGWIHSFWMATPGHYKVPELIVKVAQERTKPFVHRSVVPASSRHDVHRTTYHSVNYALCSQWDRGGGPTDGLYKEARRNMLKWVSDKGSCTFAVCMENPSRPYALQENKANKIGYGENAFSQYMQHEGTLMGVYTVPMQVTSGRHTFDYPYTKLYAPFPKNGSIVKRIEKSGWVFCHNGSMLMAFYCVKPHTWKPWGNNDMLWCEARKNGWVLETSELTPFAGGGVDAELDRFAEAMLAKTKVDARAIDQALPTLRYQSLTGHTLEQTWIPHQAPVTDQNKVDGKPINYKNWPMLSNPWVYQEAGSPHLIIKFGKKSLTYDFSKRTRTEKEEP